MLFSPVDCLAKPKWKRKDDSVTWIVHLLHPGRNEFETQENIATRTGGENQLILATSSHSHHQWILTLFPTTQDLSNLIHLSFFRGFNGIRTLGLCAFALQCSIGWAMKTHTLRTGQFIELKNPWKEWNIEWNDVNCGNAVHIISYYKTRSSVD